MTIMDIRLWQRILTPHMAGLAVARAADGHRVTYVAERIMSAERAAQEWIAPETPGIDIHLIGSEENARSLVERAEGVSIHLCQGIRTNGQVAVAQYALAARGLRSWS
jgi:hypothetical protein